MITMRPGLSAARQGGMVMLISLILLVAVTLMVVTGSNLVQTNLKVVKNIEGREQSRFAALAAIEEALSDPRFATTPLNIFLPGPTGCTDANQRCYDSNGDGIFDVTVVIDPPPRCVMVSPKKNSELQPWDVPLEATCYLPDTVFSMCAESVWEFVATATDVATGAEVVVRQGVSIETTLNNIAISCP